MSQTSAGMECRAPGAPRWLPAALVLLSTALVAQVASEEKTLVLAGIGAVAILFAMAAWIDPWVGLIGYLCYSAVHLYLIALIPTYTDDILYLVLAFLVFLNILVKPSVRARVVLLDGPYIALLLLYTAYAVASMGEPSLGVLWGARDTFQFLTFSLIVPIVIPDERKLMSTVEWVVWVGFGVACLALLGAVAGPLGGLVVTYVAPSIFLGPPETRVVSTMGNPNTLAAAMAFCILLVAPRLGAGRAPRGRLLAAVQIAVYLVAIVLALSRAALYILVVTVVLLLVFGRGGVLAQTLVVLRGRVPRRLLTTMMVLPILMSGALFLSLRSRGISEKLSRFSLLSASARASGGERVRLWRMLQNTNWNWTTGSGIGSYSRAGASAAVLTVTDSSYLKLLIEQGVIGLLLFAAGPLYLFLFRARRPAPRGSPIGDLRWSLIGIMLFVGILSLPYSTLDIYPINAWFWLLCGTLLCRSSAPEGHEDPADRAEEPRGEPA